MEKEKCTVCGTELVDERAPGFGCEAKKVCPKCTPKKVISSWSR